jgi:hypothetical protein
MEIGLSKEAAIPRIAGLHGGWIGMKDRTARPGLQGQMGKLYTLEQLL